MDHDIIKNLSDSALESLAEGLIERIDTYGDMNSKPAILDLLAVQAEQKCRADLAINTTSGETFSAADHRALAMLVYRRFGRDTFVATAAWQRMLGNNCTIAQFMELVGDA